VRSRRLAATPLLLVVAAVVFLTAACTEPETLRFLVNYERSSRQIGQLGEAGDLGAKAQRHSEEMAAQRDLHHSNLSSGVSSSWTRLGENVAVAPTLVAAHEALMRSAGHRANILDGRFTSLGTGAARAANGSWYVTEEFGG
jgi:uncharacterized protein YkwD